MLAAAIAWFGIRINAWYGETLGKSPEASSLLAGLSKSADVLALTLPATARALSAEGHRCLASVAWAIWTVTIAIALQASVGFAAPNIADATAARGRAPDVSAMLTMRISHLQAEQATMIETRPIGTIEAELQRAQPGAAAVWRATSGCHDVTLPQSGQTCAAVLALREAVGAAQRRDTIDADLHDAQEQLGRVPAIMSADPQAETAVRLINWATFGVVKVTANDIGPPGRHNLDAANLGAGADVGNGFVAARMQVGSSVRCAGRDEERCCLHRLTRLGACSAYSPPFSMLF